METGFVVAVVVVGLVLFGVLYDRFVGWLERSGHDRGYTAFLVVIGTAVTLAAAMPLVGVRAVMWLVVCFGASGLPMIVGSWARASRARKLDEERAMRLAKELLDDKAEDGRVRYAAGDYTGDER